MAEAPETPTFEKALRLLLEHLPPSPEARPAPKAARPRSPVPEYLIQQQREGIPGANTLGREPSDQLDVLAKRERMQGAGFDPGTIPDAPDMPRVRPGDLPYMPPIRQGRGPEIRNTNEPVSDWVAQRIDPMVGRRVQQFTDIGHTLEDTPGIGPIVRMGEQLTGTPAITHGALNINRGLEEGSPWRVAGGAAEAGAGLIPAAVGVRALRPAIASTPGILGGAAAVTAGDVLPAYADDLQQKTPRQLELEKYEGQRNDLQKEIDKIYGAKAPPPPALNRRLNDQQMKVQTDAARQQWMESLDARAKPYKDRMAPLNDAITKAQDAITAESQGERPFRQQYPGATRAIQAVGEFGPTAIAWRGGVTTRNNIAQAIKDYEVAVAAKDPVGVSRAQDLLTKYTGQTWGEFGKHKAAMVAGGLAGSTLANIVPELSDLSSEQQHGAALNKLTGGDPEYLKERALQIGIGGGLGPFVGEEIGRFAPGAANYQKAKAFSSATPFAPGANPAPPVVAVNGLAQGGPQALGPTAWPPAARAASRDYVGTRTGDMPSISTGDVLNALSQQGIAANPRNVATRLQTTKDFHAANPPQGRALQGEDVANAPATWQDGGRRRQLLGVAGPAGAAAAALPGEPDPQDTRQLRPQPSTSQAQGQQSPRTTPESDTAPSDLPPGVRRDVNGVLYDAHTGQKIRKRLFEDRNE